SGMAWRGRDRSRLVANPRGTGLRPTPGVSHANRYAYKPDTLDRRRWMVRADTPEDPSMRTTVRSPLPCRCERMKSITSAVLTRAGGLPTTVKNVFKSY